MRPADLAREHGLSTQAIRNYESSGFLPPAARTDSGYRVYTEVHAAALRAFIALIPAHGHATAGHIMVALNTGAVDHALTLIDRSHEQLLRDRETLASVRVAIGDLTSSSPVSSSVLSIGELAHRLGVTAATIRTWEAVGILTPARDPATGYRVYQPEDVRDAELAGMLRRGGYRLDHIAAVLVQVRTAGGAESLAKSLDGWQARLTAQGLAMLTGSAALSAYLVATSAG